MLARSNGPVLDAQRTFNYQTATVLRGASARYRDLCLEQKSQKLLLGFLPLLFLVDYPI